MNELKAAGKHFRKIATEKPDRTAEGAASPHVRAPLGFSSLGRIPWLSLVVLTLCTLWIFLLRWHNFDQTARIDIALYAVDGHELHQGAVFYKDFWEIKPPAGIWTFALAEWLVGYGQQQVFFIGTVTALLTLAGIYLVGCRLHNRTAGLLAAVLWALTNSEYYLDAQQPNIEVFMNCLLVWFLAVALGSLTRDETWTWQFKPGKALLLGLVVALSALYKQFTVATYLLIFFGLWTLQSTSDGRRALLKSAAVALFACGLAWAGVIYYLQLTGSFSGFVVMLTKLGAAYSDSPLHNLVRGAEPGRILGRARKPYWPLVIAMAAALWVSRGNRGDIPVKRLLWAVAIATWLAVSLPGKFWNHYYQLWMPLLCIWGGWALLRLYEAESGSKWLNRKTGRCLAALVLAFYGIRSGLALAHPAPRERILNKQQVRMEPRELGQELAKLTTDQDRIYVWGKESRVNFYAKRRPGCSVDLSAFLPQKKLFPAGFPLADVFLQQFLRDMEATKPVFVVMENGEDTGGPAFQYIQQHYVTAPAFSGHGFTVLVRRGARIPLPNPQDSRL